MRKIQHVSLLMKFRYCLYRSRFIFYGAATFWALLTLWHVYQDHGLTMTSVYTAFAAFVLVRIPHVFGKKEGLHYDYV